MAEDRICAHRWWASRIEVVDSVPVLHVCNVPEPHAGIEPHRCSCGAVLTAPHPALGWSSSVAAGVAAAPPQARPLRCACGATAHVLDGRTLRPLCDGCAAAL
jgi:hypothetical protein